MGVLTPFADFLFWHLKSLGERSEERSALVIDVSRLFKGRASGLHAAGLPGRGF
jgi:hypothetical protein